MEMQHTIDKNVLVLTPQLTTLDANNVIEFKNQVTEFVRKTDINKLVLNMERITFIDSMGLGSLISMLKMMNKKAGDLRLACISKTVRAIVEIVRVHKIFQIFPDAEKAVTSFEEAEDKSK